MFPPLPPCISPPRLSTLLAILAAATSKGLLLPTVTDIPNLTEPIFILIHCSTDPTLTPPFQACSPLLLPLPLPHSPLPPCITPPFPSHPANHSSQGYSLLPTPPTLSHTPNRHLDYFHPKTAPTQLLLFPLLPCPPPDTTLTHPPSPRPAHSARSPNLCF